MATITSLPQTATVRAGRYQMAENLGRIGYVLSESVYAKRLYYVYRPDGKGRYQVDLVRGTCTCPATVRDCKHILWVEKCLRFSRQLTPRKAEKASRMSRHFSKRHIAGLRQATTCAAVISLYPPVSLQADAVNSIREYVDDALCCYVAAETAKRAGFFQESMNCEDRYVEALERLSRHSGYGLLDCRTAIEFRKGGCVAILAAIEMIEPTEVAA